MIDATRYQELFRSEAEELLARLERELLRLEEDRRSPGALAEAFRALHTLKGMASTLGLDAFAGLAHALEDAVELLRTGDATPAGFFEAALEAVDVLRGGLAGAETADFAARAAALGGRLRELRAAASPPLDPALPPPPSGPDAAHTPAAPAPAAATLRIGRRLLDRVLNEAGELVVLTERLEALGRLAGDAELREAARRASRLAAGLQEQVLAARMVPLSRVYERFPRALRDHARRTGKVARLVLAGGDIEMDRAVLDGVAEPLLHLLRNAVDHGIEPPSERRARGKPAAGTVSLAGWRGGPGVVLEVSDDGRGLDRTRLREAARALSVADAGDLARMPDAAVDRLATVSGLSTAAEVSATSGRGVGLDAVQAAVTRLGGSLSIRSAEGHGAAFRLHLPVTLALVRALLVEDAGARYAVALGALAETRRVASGDGSPSLARLLDARGAARAAGGPAREPRVLVLEAAGERLAVRVDGVAGAREVVVRSLPPLRGRTLPFHGVSVLGDGSLALLVDVARLVTASRRSAVPITAEAWT